jgi:hypothetical protein
MFHEHSPDVNVFSESMSQLRLFSANARQVDSALFFLFHNRRQLFANAGDETIQGSSTVRAPAQAGDAGSSPAPVAKPDLTTMVLDIVTAQLNELESRRRRAAA